VFSILSVLPCGVEEKVKRLRDLLPWCIAGMTAYNNNNNNNKIIIIIIAQHFHHRVNAVVVFLA